MKPAFPLVAFVLALTICCAAPPQKTSTVRGPGPILLMIPGRIAPEGSYEECVIQNLAQGTPLKQAMDLCRVGLGRLNPGLTIDPPRLMTGREVGLSPVDCYEAKANPRAEGQANENTRQLTVDFALFLAAWNRLLTDYDEAGQGIGDLTIEDVRSTGKSLESRFRDLQRRTNALSPDQKKIVLDHVKQWLEIEERLEFLRAFGVKESELKGHASEPGDFPPPDPNEGGVAHSIPGTNSLCIDAAQFIAECNDTQWRSDACTRFLSRLKNCADPRVADPVSGEDTCMAPTITGQQAHDAYVAWCERRPARAQEGVDPCKPFVLDATVTEFFYGRNSGKLDPCHDPHALILPEDCAPTFSIVEFGVPEIDKLQKFGLEKLGGPVFIIPKPAPEPPLGPKPTPTAPADPNRR